MQGIKPTSGKVRQGLDSRHEEESHGSRVRRVKKNAMGGKAEKRISVDGIGGVFINANDAKALSNWYAHHFGLKLETYEDGKVYGTEFKYRRLSDSSKVDSTVFSITQSKVTLPSERKEAVINYRVRDLAAFLEQLKADGIEIEKTEDFDYGRFAWIKDPEGNRIELYQPLN
jgi:predicted enzyme related to lactoylglutathione lyase